MRSILALFTMFGMLSIAFSGILVDADGANEVFGPPMPKMAKVNIQLDYPNATPAGGMWVYIHQMNSYYSGSNSKGMTAPDGSLTIDIAPHELGPCYIVARNSTDLRWVREEIYIEPGKTYDREMVLKEALPMDRTISGTVTEASTGTPEADSTIQLYGTDAEGRSVQITRKTITDGSYSLNVPYSVFPYQMFIYPKTSGLRMASTYVYMNTSVMDYELDVELYRYGVSVPLSLRFMDSYTDTPIEYGSIYVYHMKEYDDHYRSMDYHYYTIENGYYNVSGGRGEYRVDLSTALPYMNGSVSFYTENNIIMEDSPLNVVFDLPLVHDYRDVVLNVVRKGTGEPVSFSYAETDLVYLKGSEYDMDTRTTAVGGTDGIVRFGIVPDREYIVKVRANYHDEVTIRIPKGGIGELYSGTVELEYNAPPTIETADVSFLAKDLATGRPLPYYIIYASSDHTSYGFQTDEHGYANVTIAAEPYKEITVTGNLGKGTVTGFEPVTGQSNPLTVYLTERAEFDRTPMYETVFRVVDPSGAPIPWISFPIIHRLGEFSYEMWWSYSDGDGSVRFSGHPGDYEILGSDNFDYLRGTRMYHMPPKGTGFTLPSGGEGIQDITFYDSHPFTDVTGSVKDVATGEMIHQAGIQYSTGALFNSTSDGFDVEYLSFQTGSTKEGSFRMWGKDEIYYTCTYPGYYPQKEKLDLSSRSLTHTIYLESLLDLTATIGGTLVDHMNRTVAGEISVLDLDRDLYEVNSTVVDEDGIFSMGVYPGNFRIDYWNGTVSESIELTVGEEGVSGLLLVLSPETIISGTVVDWSGTPVPGIPIEIRSDGQPVAMTTTDGDGGFDFEVSPGTYMLYFGGNELYEMFYNYETVATGFADHEITVVLLNRTTGIVRGTVIGLHPDGSVQMAGANVTLMDGSNGTLSWGSTNDTGGFEFPYVPYGTGYRLMVDPPEGLLADESIYLSGYLPEVQGPFDLNSHILEMTVELPYRTYSPPGYFNVTSASPDGTGVPLNQVISLTFSEPIDADLFMVTITPSVTGLTYGMLDSNMTVVMTHDGFLPNTTYEVTIGDLVVSESGHVLWVRPYTWNFTTGATELTWWLSSKLVFVDDHRMVSVTANGAQGIEVHFIIEDIGSFPLSEGPVGTYTGTVPGAFFGWDEEYRYHFSDSENGTDMAPFLAGTFRTPSMPDIWTLTSASVTVDEDGNWVVTAAGNPDQDVWIVIDGIGSFKLAETSPGVYGVTIPESEFDPGERYDYWFSDSEGGDDMAPALSGDLKTKGEGDDPAPNYGLFCCLGISAVILLLMVVVVLLLLARKGKGGPRDEKWDEE